MTSMEHRLATPPADERGRELWLKHVAGFILFENVRKRALKEIADIEPNANAGERAIAAKAVDETVYALMRLIDGEAWMENEAYEVDLKVVARLVDKASPLQPVQVLNLDEGDGFAMAFHGWMTGDFGDDPVVVG